MCLHSCALVTSTRVTCPRRNWPDSKYTVAMVASSPHISSNTNKHNGLCELAHHTKRRLCPAKPVQAFCCFHSVAPVWKLFLNSNWSSLLIPIHREDYVILHHTTCNGTAPIFIFVFFALLHRKALAVLPPCVRAVLQHTATPISPQH